MHPFCLRHLGFTFHCHYQVVPQNPRALLMVVHSAHPLRFLKFQLLSGFAYLLKDWRSI